MTAVAERPSPAASSSQLSVSFIICTYRREESLRLLLSDLLAQSRRADRIILVDQTPEHEPETNELFRQFGDAVERIRVEEPNLPNARNIGLRAANEDILIFIDDDVRVSADFVADLVPHFDETEVDGAAPVVVVVGEEPPGAWIRGSYRFGADWKRMQRIEVSRIIGACMALRRSIVEEIGGFEALMGRLSPSASAEDYEFCGRWVGSGHRLWLIPSVSVFHAEDVPGGCEVRMLEPSEASRRVLLGVTFMILKQEQSFERLSIRALARMLRVTVVRRDVLSAGPRAWLRGLSAMVSARDQVRQFWRVHQADA